MDVYVSALIDAAQDMMIVCDETGAISMVNAVALEALGYKKEEIINENVSFLFLDKNFSIMDILEGCREETCEITATVYRQNKTCFPAKVKVVYLREYSKYVLSGSDITELVQAQKEISYVREKAEEALKVRDEIVANVTHELRTPVNGIKGHTQYLMMTELTKDQSKELKIITDCCLNMEQLINNILDFSKLEAGKLALDERDFNFMDCMSYLTETNGKLIEEKGLRFVVNVDSAIPPVLYGDDFRLKQILNNLLSNALKFTQKGYIALEVAKSMQFNRDIELFFMVMDTGVGIPEEKKDQLFQSFTQVDASISRTYGGTGLGLAITKQLVDMMKGSIRLESEPGKGSTFSFSVRMRIPESVEVEHHDEVIKTLKLDHVKRARSVLEESDKMNIFGTKENRQEFDRMMEKMIICVDMENYEKAEFFADSVKSLILDGPAELKQLAFRMQMMIRKEDGVQARKYYEELRTAVRNAYAHQDS